MEAKASRCPLSGALSRQTLACHLAKENRFKGAFPWSRGESWNWGRVNTWVSGDTVGLGRSGR